jgi:hypothetical protein
MASGAASPLHRVRRVVFELRLPDEAAALRHRSEMEDAWHQTILPVVEEAFDAGAPDGRFVRIDRMAIDIGHIDPRRLDGAAIRRAVLAELTRHLHGGSEERPEPLSEAAALEEVLAAFLQTGAWPWDAATRRTEALEAALAALPTADARRAAGRVVTLLGDRRVRLRLAYQFRDELLRWLAAQLYPDRVEEILGVLSTAVVAASGGPGPGLAEVRASAWRALLAAVLHLLSLEPTAPRATIERWIVEERRRLQFPDADATAEADRLLDAGKERTDLASAAPRRERDRETDGPVSELYVAHAGVVLLHPFLDRFFRTLGLVTEGRTLDATAHRVRATHLLYHLVTGREQPEEHETALLKVLSGLPLRYPLVRELSLAQEDREEAERLLRAAVSHWDRLKNTSPDGLREAFLQREGKLSTRPDGWRLVVEQRAVDVLLDSVPWSVSIVRLPWMASPLWVDWA